MRDAHGHWWVEPYYRCMPLPASNCGHFRQAVAPQIAWLRTMQDRERSAAIAARAQGSDTIRCLFVGACCSRRRGAPKRARLQDDVELTSSRDGASDDVKHLATIPEERSGRSENDHL